MGYLVAAFAILLALSQQRKGVELLEAALKDRSDLLAHVLQALVLPYATWLILLAMAVLALADFTSTRLTREPIEQSILTDHRGNL